MILADDERRNIIDGVFVLDCPLIIFEPRIASANKRSYRGGGYVSIHSDGYIEIKLYCSDDIHPNAVFERSGLRAGEIIAGDYYYAAQATDLAGRRWNADYILPDVSAGPEGAVVTGRAAQITSKRDFPAEHSGHRLAVTYAFQINIPCNTVLVTHKQASGVMRGMKSEISIARHEACGIHFDVEKNRDHTTLVAASPNREFTDDVADIIIDSFQFVTAIPDTWAIYEVMGNGVAEARLRATGKPRKSRIGQPVSANAGNSADYWELFSKYVAFELSDSMQARGLKKYVGAVISSGMASLEVEALTLSTSIESFLKKYFAKQIVGDKELKRSISTVCKIVEEATEVDDGFKERLLGSLNAMSGHRAKDYLLELQKRGLIDRVLVDVFGKLRNSSAHGSGINDGEVQDYFDKCSSVLVLFYQLIFLVIGYKGSYSDYGTYGYPVRQFTAHMSEGAWRSREDT